MCEENSGRMAEEEEVREKTDEKGTRWKKLYVGGGAHFRNWLSQVEEIYGRENVEIEEINSSGFECFEDGHEKMHRIWVKVNVDKSQE